MWENRQVISKGHCFELSGTLRYYVSALRAQLSSELHCGRRCTYLWEEMVTVVESLQCK